MQNVKHILYFHAFSIAQYCIYYNCDFGQNQPSLDPPGAAIISSDGSQAGTHSLMTKRWDENERSAAPNVNRLVSVLGGGRRPRSQVLGFVAHRPTKSVQALDRKDLKWGLMMKGQSSKLWDCNGQARNDRERTEELTFEFPSFSHSLKETFAVPLLHQKG
ncbi:hypothetical protein DdX_04686 [Ditylenchus destructor]|uniref:Uncharacterized protein n=1 Tax=Ditylenchus destructor TaxID=166010 RepID=A0AAD4N9X4_9BILA|nr:hypothetical protein DdX_04686 [Ditylenchus destructor]